MDDFCIEGNVPDAAGTKHARDLRKAFARLGAENQVAAIDQQKSIVGKGEFFRVALADMDSGKSLPALFDVSRIDLDAFALDAESSERRYIMALASTDIEQRNRIKIVEIFCKRLERDRRIGITLQPMGPPLRRPRNRLDKIITHQW